MLYSVRTAEPFTNTNTHTSHAEVDWGFHDFNTSERPRYAWLDRFHPYMLHTIKIYKDVPAFSGRNMKTRTNSYDETHVPLAGIHQRILLFDHVSRLWCPRLAEQDTNQMAARDGTRWPHRPRVMLLKPCTTAHSPCVDDTRCFSALRLRPKQLCAPFSAEASPGILRKVVPALAGPLARCFLQPQS